MRTLLQVHIKLRKCEKCAKMAKISEWSIDVG